jgi:RHS repeat-associated protein
VIADGESLKRTILWRTIVSSFFRTHATAEFDNVSIYTEAVPSGAVGNPPALPAPTSTAGAADVATESYDSPAFYYNLNDHLGTARITMNQSGAVTSSVEYFPFGELKSATGCAASSQRFTGKLFDNESGLQYFGARYLSNDLTRFTSVDPARESFDPNIPQSWNRYSYVQNDPLTYVDPTGKWLETAVDIASLGLSIHALIKDPYSSTNYLAVTADVITLILPVAAAGGTIVRGTKAAVTRADDASDAIKLKKSLASRQQLGEAGEVIAGGNSGKEFRDAQKMAEKYGGEATNYVKKSSSNYEAPDGTKMETHWVENTKTGQRYEEKTKIQNKPSKPTKEPKSQ